MASQKRTRCPHEPDQRRAAKKARTESINSPLTERQQSIIFHTAAAFHISPVGLAIAIGNLQRSSREEVVELKPQSALPQMAPYSDNFDDLAMPASMNSPSLPPPYPAASVGMSTSESTRRGDRSGPANTRYMHDNIFGFPVIPGAWADCFAGMNPLDGNLANGAIQGRTHFPYPRTEFTKAADEDFVTPSGSYSESTFPPEKSSNSYLGSVSHNYQALDHQAASQDVAEVCSWQDYFHCDSSLMGSSGVTSRWVEEKPIQSPQLQMTQPSSLSPPMVYSNVASSTPTQWYAAGDLQSGPPNGYYDAQHALSDVEMFSNSESLCQGDSTAAVSPNIEKILGPFRRGPFKSTIERLQTAETRKSRACIRCRMQRIRCEPDPSDPRGVCLTCKKVSMMKFAKLPCLRYKIADVAVFKVGFVAGHVWSSRWQSMELKDINVWASSDVKTIQITQDYSPSPLTLEVKRFIPVEGDMLTRSWAHDGITKSVKLPPYAIANIETAAKAYKEYINEEGPKFFTSTLNRNDKLLWETYSAAVKASNNAMTESERITLKMVLRLWVAIRMTTRSERICGQETLGMASDIMDQTSPMHGKIPITPVMGAQIDLIITRAIMLPLKAQILDRLQKLVLANKPSHWFCVYICVFILLHNCSLLTIQDLAYVKKHGLKTRFAKPDTIAELHTGANVLLAYFHYCSKGVQPFALDWNAAETMSIAELTPEQIAFVRRTAAYVKEKENRFLEIQEGRQIDAEYYFVAQLYEKDWKPRFSSQ